MGRVYMTLSELTNGLALNICTVDWVPLINEVSTKIVEASTRECIYDIPMRPDEDQIEIEFTTSHWSSRTMTSDHLYAPITVRRIPWPDAHFY